MSKFTTFTAVLFPWLIDKFVRDALRNRSGPKCNINALCTAMSFYTIPNPIRKPFPVRSGPCVDQRMHHLVLLHLADRPASVYKNKPKLFYEIWC